MESEVKQLPAGQGAPTLDALQAENPVSNVNCTARRCSATF